MITRTFITGIAALLLATGTAHADALPKEMLGKWCSIRSDYKDDGDQNITSYQRRKCNEDKDLDGRMTLRPNAIEYWEEGCTFTSITPRQTTSWWYDEHGKIKQEYRKTYEIKTNCSGMEEYWNTTIWLTYWPISGNLEHISYVDNELPFDTKEFGRTFCRFPADQYGPVSYHENPVSGCESKVQLRFEKDRYTILRDGAPHGFCRYGTINTVWDPNLGVATKELGGPVTYITSQCPLGKTKLRVFWSKGSMYMEDVK
jgi:hypothetical protein